MAVGIDDYQHSCTDSHSTLGDVPVWTLQHLVPAEQLYCHTNGLAAAQRNTAEHCPELVVVGTEGLDDHTCVVGNNPKPLP